MRSLYSDQSESGLNEESVQSKQAVRLPLRQLLPLFPAMPIEYVI
ncbi:MAG: hypothetical protein U1D41_07990 [Nitrosomonas sp.]|nr:hypothetical protein [Nitrosomonas sp.]MDO8894639.1 hypothetical protein [Nitrosomonas sp.]MDP1549514.1 hypothetical protein [Nitrosomonas sp.]MDP3281417.1 hypothetical protein [Nitrosomonas sp.]MDP3664145.1 hypothetical protein [Nitrosomonas sp.]MDZ4106087.1 hypothetical protein [Nitrosomonas sp.]